MASLAQQEHRPRREPRVAYSAPVRLSGDWSDREPCFVPLLTQSLDLSENGMALVTPLPLPRGSIVTCSMRVGGCQLYVVGSVRWEHMADDGMRRAGIEFLPPSHEDTGLMRRLLDLGKLHPHRIHMRFDGRPDTLTALAQVTRSGVSLTAPLPILRRNTGVRFAFAHKGAHGTSFHGQIDRVKLSQLEGMPALQVGIRVSNVEALHSVAQDAERAVEASRPREDATPRAIEVVSTPNEPAGIGLAASAYALARSLQSRMGALRLPTSLAVMLGIAALGAGALAHELSRAPSPPEGAPQHTAQPVATTPAVQAARPEPSVALVLGDPVIEPGAIASESTEAPQRELTFKWRRMRREIFVPLEGELGSLQHFRVGEPLGITVDLPNVAPPDQLERHAVRKPGVQRVDIAPQGRGTRIRVWATRPFADYRVEPARGGVRIIIPGPF
jgi:hypothetical protein